MDFDAELPVISVWLIRIGGAIKNYWYLGIGFLLFDLILLFLLSRTPRGMRWLTHLWAVGVLLVCLILMAFLIVAGIIPTARLMNELGA